MIFLWSCHVILSVCLLFRRRSRGKRRWRSCSLNSRRYKSPSSLSQTHDDWNSFEICLCPSEWIIEQAGGEHSLNNSSVIRSSSDLTQTTLSVLFSGMDRTSLWALLALTECSNWSHDTSRRSRHSAIILVLNYYY